MEKANKKIKPQCAEDLLNLRQEDMSNEEWYSEIMRHWHCCRKTVYNWFKQFGIETRPYQYGDTPHIYGKWHQRCVLLEEENALLKEQIELRKELYKKELIKKILTILDNELR